MKQLVPFLEKNLEEKDIVRLNFFSEPDSPMMGNGTFKSSILVPGKKEAFYLSPPNKDKLPKNSSLGSVLLGAISHGKLSYVGQEEGKNSQKNPISYQISYVVPPIKTDEDKGKGSSSTCTKPIAERLEEEVRDAKKKKVFESLKQNTDKDRSEWKILAQSLKFGSLNTLNTLHCL